MKPWLLAAGALLLAEPATAQSGAYCNGRLTAESFEVRGTTGPEGRSHFLAHLRNTHSVPIRVVVLFTGDALGRPDGRPRSLPPGEVSTVALGYQNRRPGLPPMTPDRLAAATRISCQ